MGYHNQLTTVSFRHALDELSKRDADLRKVIDNYGPPPMWTRDPGFPTLVQIILEQQVSLASAKAAFGRLLEATPSLTPSSFLLLDDATLKAIGFSRQKSTYCRELSRTLLQGALNLKKLNTLDDPSAAQELRKINGVGEWTAAIYLLMALRRPDIWPHGDLALILAAQKLVGSENKPSSEEMIDLSDHWKPWRSVAARILWHFYLSTPRKS